MTIGEAISAVLSGTGLSTDDFPVPRRFVYRELKFARAELIKQELNKNNLFNESSAQTLECIRMERVDASTCLDCSSGIYVLKSVDPIPKLIHFDSGPAVVELFMQNGAAINPLSFSDWDNRKKRRNQLPGSFGYAFRNDSLYLLDYDDVDELDTLLSGHFNDPEEVTKFNQKNNPDCGTKCSPITSWEFPCSGYVERRIIEIVRAVVLRKLGIPLDTNNNAKFDPDVKSKTSPGQ